MYADLSTLILLGIVAALVLVIGGIALFYWLQYRLGVWLADRQADAEARTYWTQAARDQADRHAELDDLEAESGGYLVERVDRWYRTAEEYSWDANEMAERGYRQAGQPFTDGDGYIVVTYVPAETASVSG